MSAFNNVFSERNKIDVAIAPADLGGATTVSAWFPMAGYQRITFSGAIGAITDVVDMKLQEATDNAGTGAQDLSGFTGQYTATDDNLPFSLGCEESDLSEGFGYVGITVTATSVAAIGAVLAFRDTAKTEPVTQDTLVFDVN